MPARQAELLLMSRDRRSGQKKQQRGLQKGPVPAKGKLSLGGLMNHYLVLLLFLTLLTLSLPSVNRAMLVGVLGLILCAAGLTHGAAKVDLWFLIPLIGYQIFCALSFYMNRAAVSADSTGSFLALQALYSVLYLLMAYLDDGERLWLKRLCALWVGCTAAAGLVQFLSRALAGRAARLGGVFQARNAFGIFLVVGWFALRSCVPEETDLRGSPLVWLVRLEPLLLTVLALTLSMGSFISMAAGILLLALCRLRRTSWREALTFTCDLLARASLGVGLGILIYVAARRSGQPWLCIPLTVYLLAAMLLWDRFRSFLRDFPKAAAGITAFGFLVAGAAILIRPSAVATFQERLAMMKNAAGYLTVHPLWGLGFLQWHIWNFYDADIYFNTYHIHNILLHIGVEFGIPAMVLAGAAAVRRFWKKGSPDSTAGFLAFFLHNMMDTSFFFEGNPAVALLTVAEPGSGGTRLSGPVMRLFFGAGVLFFLARVYISLGYF